MTQFLAANWLWIALIVAMFAMHRHGGCGSHGHDHHRSAERGAEKTDRSIHSGHPTGGRSQW